MISIPVAVNIPFFKWQVDLWWWSQKKIYGEDADKKSFLIMIDKNFSDQVPLSTDWYKSIPHHEATGVWKTPVPDIAVSFCVPINIQLGLKECLDRFDDYEILEIIDADCFHFRPHLNIDVKENTLYVCDVYEDWHLFSRTKNKFVIDPYLKNNGDLYNGGFVPIIGFAKTFKKIINDWENIHRDILKRNLDNHINWWGGMFSLQAACERENVKMIANDVCYIPANELKENHYMCHYSVDRIFDKRKFPNIDINIFPNNDCYNQIKEWMDTK